MATILPVISMDLHHSYHGVYLFAWNTYKTVSVWLKGQSCPILKVYMYFFLYFECKFVYAVCKIIRPVVEYACPLWHNALTSDQAQQIEMVQKRAFRIIFPQTYPECVPTNIKTLTQRRDTICQSFFGKICISNDKLHYLINPTSTRKTCHSKKYSIPRCRTERFKNSFISYALYNYQ